MIPEEPSFETLTEGRKWLGCRYLLRQSVPDTRSSNCKSPVTDCWMPGRWHQQTTGATRAKCPSARQIGNRDEWSQIPRHTSCNNCMSVQRPCIRSTLGCAANSLRKQSIFWTKSMAQTMLSLQLCVQTAIMDCVEQPTMYKRKEAHCSYAADITLTGLQSNGTLFLCAKNATSIKSLVKS